MKNLNICIDIDGTVTEPFYWLEKANSYFGKNLKPRDIRVYDVEEAMGLMPGDYDRFYDEFGEELHRGARMRSGVTEVIRRHHLTHYIHFVTARDMRMKEVSIEWLKGNNIAMDSIALLGSHDKVGKAYELRCDIFIEDRYENALQLAEAGYDVILIDCSYNKGPLPSNVTRLKHWYQVDRFIAEYSVMYDSLELVL